MLSIIIPFYNEKESLPVLYAELTTELKKHGTYEIVFVDDGSSDDSFYVADSIVQKDSRVQLIRNRTRLGKGNALTRGIAVSRGDVLIFMDADLQDDPQDISQFLKKLGAGFDLVNGMRVTRKDNLVIRAYSKAANWFLRAFVHSPFTDINCGFKVLRRAVLDEVVLYGNNFRFLPVAAHISGFAVSEIAVHNRERTYGKSKFGIGKIFVGFFDTFTAYFLYKFAERPLHFFGIAGLLFFAVGFLVALYLTIERVFFQVLLYRRPMLQFAILMILVGIQILMTGILGELIVYIHKKRNPRI